MKEFIRQLPVGQHHLRWPLIKGQRLAGQADTKSRPGTTAIMGCRLPARWLLLLLIVPFCLNLFAAAPAPGPKPLIIAYVFPRNSLIQSGQIAAQKLSRINYAFSNIEKGRMVEGYPSDGANFTVLNSLKRENPSLKVLISVGGWLWSGNFSDMALTPVTRGVFIESVVEFVKRYQLDGLDIDWEYPGSIGAGNKFRPEDKQNYTLLLQELRSRFDIEEGKLHRRLYLSIATGASSEFLANTQMDKVQLYVDTVNLMAYDYYEPGPEGTTGHHSPLFTNPADPRRVSADNSVQEYEQAGVPAKKIVLGVPFYGHMWGEVPAQNHGLFQPGKPVPNASSGYGEISANLLDHGFTRYWDDIASAPYLYSEEKHIFVSYEDPQSLAVKSKYIIQHKLAGAMFWAYSSDPTGSLLNCLNNSLSAGAAPAKQSK